MAVMLAPEDAMPFGDILGPAAATTADASMAPGSVPPPKYSYTYVQYLGRGGYGLTYVVNRQRDGMKMVVKILALQATTPGQAAGPVTGPLQGIERSSINKVMLEIANLEKISTHFGVTRLHEWHIVDSRHALLFMEFCDAGDLHREISRQRRRASQFPEDTIKIVLLQLVFSIHHLHRHKMMHRDVKASNVLLCTNGLVKMADFGLSKTVSTVASTFCGTPTHLAPEVWEKSQYGNKADIWSLGIVLYHMMTLTVPFACRGQYEALRKQVLREDYVKPSQIRPVLPYSRDLIELCEKMLTRDPGTRPDTYDVLATPIVSQMIARWPSLIGSTPGITDELRGDIFKVLREDGIYDGDNKPIQIQRPSNSSGAEEAEEFTVDTTAINDEQRRESESAGRVDRPDPTTPSSLRPGASTTEPSSANSLVLQQGVVWKGKASGWDLRGMSLSQNTLVLYSLDIATAGPVITGAAPTDTLPSIAEALNQQKLNIGHIDDAGELDAVAVDDTTCGVDLLPERKLFPIRVVRKSTGPGSKSYDLAVASAAEQQLWIRNLKSEISKVKRRQQLKEERQSTGGFATTSTSGATPPSE